MKAFSLIYYVEANYSFIYIIQSHSSTKEIISAKFVRNEFSVQHRFLMKMIAVFDLLFDRNALQIFISMTANSTSFSQQNALKMNFIKTISLSVFLVKNIPRIPFKI